MTSKAGRLAGDAIPDPESMIRVDHAGEYGASRIYAGQLAVMGNRSPMSSEIARMAQQEERHLRMFEELMARRRVRPTFLMPVWHGAGFALGALSALAGPRTAMAVTAAVETEIDRHYQQQRDELGRDEPELGGMIAEFQADELEHRDTALQHGARQSPGFPILSALVRAGCRAAIGLSKRI